MKIDLTFDIQTIGTFLGTAFTMISYFVIKFKNIDKKMSDINLILSNNFSQKDFGEFKDKCEIHRSETYKIISEVNNTLQSNINSLSKSISELAVKVAENASQISNIADKINTIENEHKEEFKEILRLLKETKNG